MLRVVLKDAHVEFANGIVNTDDWIVKEEINKLLGRTVQTVFGEIILNCRTVVDCFILCNEIDENFVVFKDTPEVIEAYDWIAAGCPEG